MDIIHGPSLLFLDEPTSGLDSTSAYSVIEKLHDIARSGSTVILTIHQPSSRILSLLDHLLVLARGQLMYQGAPADVAAFLRRMGRKVPVGESSVEYLIDVIQDYDQCPDVGVEALAEFARTGVKPPKVSEGSDVVSAVSTVPSMMMTPAKAKEERRKREEFDRSLRSPYNNASRSWSGVGRSGVMQMLMFTPPRPRTEQLSKVGNPLR